jgi:hypothetical protein
MNLETKIYRALLKLYPREFRQEYGQEMIRVFQESLRSEGSSFGFWIRVIWDVISSASHEQILGGWNMQNVLVKFGGIAALLYGFFIPAAALLAKGATITITDSNYWIYWMLELICGVAIPSVAILASLKSFSLEPTWIQLFGCLLSILALVFSRWFVVVMMVPLVDLAFFPSPWIGPFATFGLPVGLLLMAFGEVTRVSFGSLQSIPKLLIGIAMMLVLSYLPMNWSINSMTPASAEPFLIFLFCLTQLPWIGLGWLLLSSRQLPPQPRALT